MDIENGVMSPIFYLSIRFFIQRVGIEASIWALGKGILDNAIANFANVEPITPQPW